jgi:tRNA A37 threonylcarbamoyladenosine biosynthesis protein TsaE
LADVQPQKQMSKIYILKETKNDGELNFYFLDQYCLIEWTQQGKKVPYKLYTKVPIKKVTEKGSLPNQAKKGAVNVDKQLIVMMK